MRKMLYNSVMRNIEMTMVRCALAALNHPAAKEFGPGKQRSQTWIGARDWNPAKT